MNFILRSLLFILVSLICTEAAAFENSSAQGAIEKRLQQIQQTIVVRHAHHKLAGRGKPHLSSVSFASYMNSNLEEQTPAPQEQTAFKPKCNHSKSEESETSRSADVAASDVAASGVAEAGGAAAAPTQGDQVVRGPAAEPVSETGYGTSEGQ
jgi:hypothetical protein